MVKGGAIEGAAMIRASVMAYCAKCGKDMPTRKVPEISSRGRALARKVRRCIVCGERAFRPSKWRAKPATGTTGRMRHSTGEAQREAQLVSMQAAGAIRELRLCNDPPKLSYRLDVYGTRQVEALLEEIDLMAPILPDEMRRRAHEVRRSLTHLATYTPDYLYRESPDWRLVVEDWKPAPPPGWSKTAALMRVCHGIDVRLTGGKRRA